MTSHHHQKKKGFIKEKQCSQFVCVSLFHHALFSLQLLLLPTISINSYVSIHHRCCTLENNNIICDFKNCELPWSQFIGVGTGGGRGQPPQYFTLETLVIFIHAAQIATTQCILHCAPPPPKEQKNKIASQLSKHKLQMTPVFLINAMQHYSSSKEKPRQAPDTGLGKAYTALSIYIYRPKHTPEHKGGHRHGRRGTKDTYRHGTTTGCLCERTLDALKLTTSAKV